MPRVATLPACTLVYFARLVSFAAPEPPPIVASTDVIPSPSGGGGSIDPELLLILAAFVFRRLAATRRSIGVRATH